MAVDKTSMKRQYETLRTIAIMERSKQQVHYDSSNSSMDEDVYIFLGSSETVKTSNLRIQDECTHCVEKDHVIDSNHPVATMNGTNDDTMIECSTDAMTTNTTATTPKSNTKIISTPPVPPILPRVQTLTKDHVREFFTRSPVLPHELELVRPRVEQALAQALGVLEKDYTLFKKYEQPRSLKKEQEKQESVKELEASIASLVVQGDPRQYQTALLEMARRENIIVHLGTGMGKTMIALLLLQEYLENVDEQRQLVFLVPSIALVLQQFAVLQANLTFKVSIGKAYNCSVRSDTEREQVSKCRILVATHGAYLELLMHYADLFSLDKVALLILDECHHCTGSSPYACIMKNYYHTLPPSQQPRILGLTASPLIHISPSNCHGISLQQQLENFQQILNSRVVTWNNEDKKVVNSTSSDGFVPQEALEKVITFNSAQYDVNHTVAPLVSSDLYDDVHDSRRRELHQLEQLYKDVGPLCTGLYVEKLIKELKHDIFQEESDKEFQAVQNYLNMVIRHCREQASRDMRYKGRSLKLLRLELLIQEERQRQSTNMVGLVFVERRITAMAINTYFQYRRNQWKDNPETFESTSDILNGTCSSTKVSTIVEKLQPSSHDDRFADADEEIPEVSNEECGDQFDDAIEDPTLACLDIKLNLSIDVSNSNMSSSEDSNASKEVPVKSEALVRTASSIFKSFSSGENLSTEQENELQQNMLQQEANIRKVLDKLRRGEINVLIATPVVEEGVDVQVCSFVVAFDAIRSLKAYIQMKGRARQRDARFYVFEDCSACDKRLSLPNAQMVESKIQSFLLKSEVSLSPQSKYSVQDLIYNGNSTESELHAIKYGTYDAPQGSVSVRTAKAVIYRFAMSQPMDDTVRATKSALFAHLPYFDEVNDCLVLPPYLTHPSGIRVVGLPEHCKGFNKKEKQGMLSLIACVRLHQNGLLNDRLLPLQKKDFELLYASSIQENLSQAVLQAGTRNIGSCNQSYVYKIKQSGEKYESTLQKLGDIGVELAIVSREPLWSMLKLSTSVRYHHVHKEFGDIKCDLDSPVCMPLTDSQQATVDEFFKTLYNLRWRRRTRNSGFEFRPADADTLLPRYAVACISNGNFDWPLMSTIIAESKRSVEQRRTAAQSVRISQLFSISRVWSPTYDPNTKYIVYGTKDETCDAKFPSTLHDGVATYQDYFEKVKGVSVAADDRLIVGHRMWVQPIAQKEPSSPDEIAGDSINSTLDETVYFGFDGFREVNLPQTVCMEAPLANATVHLLALLLPQFLYHLEEILLVENFVESCLTAFPQLGTCLSEMTFREVATVLSTVSCTKIYSYEKLEWLGDAVLKLALTDSILKSNKLASLTCNWHEGDLSQMRSVMGSNVTLSKVCIRTGISRFIMTSPLSRGTWAPVALILTTEGVPKVRNLSTKVQADVVEALLGLVYMKKGYEASLAITDELGITLERKEEILRTTIASHSVSTMMQAVMDFTGESSLKNALLAREAFTHPTCVHSVCPSYQRLEWIGDAVLCLASRNWIYNNIESETVGKWVKIESTLTSNESLAYLSLRSGLHCHLQYCDQTLPGRIEEYNWTVNNCSRGLWGADPPKVLADLVESVIGVIHVDCGFYAGQNAAINAIKPILDLLMESTHVQEQMLLHPRDRLAEISSPLLVVNKPIKEDALACQSPNLQVWYGQDWSKINHQGNNFVCTVSLLDVNVISVAHMSPQAALNHTCSILLSVLSDTVVTTSDALSSNNINSHSIGERFSNARSAVNRLIAKNTEQK